MGHPRGPSLKKIAVGKKITYKSKGFLFDPLSFFLGSRLDTGPAP
jgi:hypothetical protein